MSPTFWRIYAALTAAILLIFSGLLAGPAIETSLSPIRADQQVTVIERSAHRLCWAWTFTKLRAIASDDLDGFLDLNGAPAGVVAPYDLDTGYPWGVPKLAVPPRAAPYRLRYCEDLPPVVRSTDTLRIRQTAIYPGFLGLWSLRVPFPDVVSEGAR